MLDREGSDGSPFWLENVAVKALMEETAKALREFIGDLDQSHVTFVELLVKFYRRIGFETVYEVTGSSMADLAHMLVWGGVGTRMDANVERLLLKWCTRFTANI
ncbi:hypothetical protein L1987_82934 [Smallanthus sonchifolius]|uniref:Uncharacterized protein n=1 Tax=Smallanthus sonchifolius TaxID=185202 RepID=A0ACB8YAP5_9ASTR|nr:hypothetical protein L1987_82934 [Smallanthus sonchifolius]